MWKSTTETIVPEQDRALRTQNSILAVAITSQYLSEAQAERDAEGPKKPPRPCAEESLCADDRYSQKPYAA